QGQIVLNGGGGTVNIILTVGNGSAAKQYDIIFELAILEGKSPFMKIPEYSKERTTLTETDVDVLFSSNLTARNAATGVKETTFTAKLYKVDAVNDEPAGEPIWTANFVSTQADTLSHITVPGAKLANAGIYAVVVGASYLGGDVDGFTTEPENFAVTAYIIVKQAPLKVTLKTLDSYSVNYDDLPTIEYTVSPSSANADVEYTIQKSGEEVSERTPVTDGTIPFAAVKPAGLKDAYTITVYARAKDADPDEAWSMDSMLVRVYNTDILELIVADVIKGEIGGTTGGVGDNANGTTINMDNHGKLPSYGITDGESYQLTVSDLNLLRTDMSLQKIISANYGSGVWGLVSDKMQWSSSDSDLVSINYKQGGTYSDIRYYSYTSYAPTSDFLLVGKDKTDGVTITATHAATGMTASVTVTADTLENQLYVFQFYPKTVTSVTYTNGAGVKRELSSDEKGVLAVYEPEGIDSAVMAISRQGDTTYVGTIFAVELQSGERDIASLQLYPCNNLRMRSISNAVLTFLNPDGSAYNGTVTLRAGVYKNGIYCPASKTFLSASPEVKYDALDDIVVTAINGKVTLGFDPTSFKINPDSLEETGAAATDKITYVIEYRIGGYKTNYVMLTVSTDSMGEQKATDSVIRLISSQTSADVPQITRQTIRQYSDGEPLTYTKDVTDFTDYIGLSKLIDKVVLYTDYVLPASVVSYDDNDIPSVSGEFALYTAEGRKLTGQMERASDKADQILDLADLDNSTLYVFPFSSSPIGRSIYTMTNETLTADGISDVGDNAKPSSSIKAAFVKDGTTLTSVTLPFGVCNLSHQEPTDGAEDAADEISSTLKSKISIAEIFNTISVNDMLKKGFLFLGGLATTSSDMPLKLMILPTEDPGVFHLIAFVGKRQNQSFGDGRLEIEYDVQKTKDDLKDLFEDNDTKVEASFSGTIILEAGYDFNTKEWKVGFLGGSVGMAFSASYEWTQNFMCGPVPATISFEVGAHAELEVSFASKASVRQMLVDATIGVSLDAFAGVGFDATIAKLKLGIYGNIGADVNFLMLSDFKHAPTTGTKLEIKGEIGIRLEVKVLFVNYKETFASTGFNWTKKYNQYDEIQRRWAESGAAEIFGLTRSGRAYSMRLLSDGTALVAIESGGELEDRDYLDLGERAWNSGIAAQRGLRKGAVSSVLVDVQTNAYPYSNPVFVDDGSMFLYISDNDNADELQSVVSYATTNGSGYDNMGPLYDVDDENAVLADSDVVASGTGSNIFAAWVKQLESPEKEMLDKTTNDDLGMMMNATEIYVGAYDGSAWTTTRLTNNSVADMSPTIASRGEKAIVAWRSLSATKMPTSGEQDISSMFNAENNIKYRMYDGATWSEATVAYNGSAGTVTAINSAMLANGTAIIAFTVRTGDDVTSTETYFTVINAAGDIVTTGRLTNDSYADTNAQVAAVGDQFVVGWYSEYDFGDVTAHDIRLARINADGSVDATFPESISVDTASDITTDFRFSAPADTDELSKLSIVWAQKQDSEDTKNTKYELSAMRFYEDGGAIGMTAPITIAETSSNFTVDYYDTYTDEQGKVHVIVLGSDYNSLDGLAEYDTIDLTNQPIETSEGSNLLTILDQNPLAYIKLGSAEFRDVAIEVTAATNIGELVPGLDLPVQFAIKNIGTSTVDKVNVQFGEVNKTVEGLALLPNQSTTITIVYPVPEGAVSDVEYTVTADDTAVVVETLVLNRPDVGISDMKLLSEENGERIVQVILYNASDIPLAGSGKTVKLGIYTSPDHEEEKRVGDLITITDADALASIDDGIYSVVQTLSVEDLIGDADEIPASGIKLYAYAWVEDCEELYLQNNDESLSFKGLLTKNNGEIVTVNTAIQVQTENETTVYTVRADIRNNSMQETSFGIPVALLLDDQGNIIAQKNLQEKSLTLTKEQTVSFSADFTAEELNGKIPATATVGAVYKVTFDVNGGSGTFDPVQTDLEGYIVLPADEPTAPEVAAGEEPLFFDGWYTDATNGTLITADYMFTADTTVYAHYAIHEHDFSYSAEGATITVVCGNTDGRHTGDTTATVTIAAPTLTVYGGTGSADATVTNNVKGVDTPEIVYKKGDIVLDAAPTDAGTYTANITVGEVTASVEYTIAKRAASVTAADKSKTYGDKDPELTATAIGAIGSDVINYTMSRTEGENAGEYTITVALGENPNYDVTATNAKLTIGKKAATVTAADKSKTYGDEEPELTATVKGLVGEDTLNCTLSRTEGENVDEYVITVTLGSNPNYDVTITGTATFTINRKAISVTPDAKVVAYGDDLALTYATTGLVGDETLKGITLTREEGNSVGTYVITATHDDTKDLNYIVTITGTATYTIDQRTVTVTPEDKAITYGDDAVALTYVATGLVGDETLTGITLTREEGANAGTYVITATHDDKLDSNYAVTISGTATYT
ncbi:MAG: InlB B-repeat-containing protein, partial [Clostridia bacterium]|nr:InlB B-repeat-containing protein [Clostridia bacterium]